MRLDHILNMFLNGFSANWWQRNRGRRSSAKDWTPFAEEVLKGQWETPLRRRKKGVCDFLCGVVPGISSTDSWSTISQAPGVIAAESEDIKIPTSSYLFFCLSINLESVSIDVRERENRRENPFLLNHSSSGGEGNTCLKLWTKKKTQSLKHIVLSFASWLFLLFFKQLIYFKSCIIAYFNRCSFDFLVKWIFIVNITGPYILVIEIQNSWLI